MADQLCSCLQDRVSHGFAFGCAFKRACALARIDVDGLCTLRAQMVPTGAIHVCHDLSFLHAKSNGSLSGALAAGAASRVSALVQGHVNNLIQQGAECHEVGRTLFRIWCLHGLVVQEILVIDIAAIELIVSIAQESVSSHRTHRIHRTRIGVLMLGFAVWRLDVAASPTYTSS